MWSFYSEFKNRVILLQPLNRFFWLFAAIFFASELSAQAGHYWSQQFLNQKIEQVLASDGEIDFMSIKPYAIKDISKVLVAQNDSALILKTVVDGFWDVPEPGKWKVDVTPLADFQLGYSNKAKGVFVTATGLATNVRFGKMWSLYSDIFIGGTRQPQYIAAFTDSTGVLPSLGKNQATDGNPSFAKPTARLSFSPSDYFQFELGYGTNSIGEGYRSLFLSDVAFNYPYLKITTDVWRFKYINIYSALDGTNPSASSPNSFEPKYTTTHYLNYAVSPRLNIGLFETIVWQGQDTLSNRGYDPNYLNPIIFYRPVEYSVGSPDNALIGIDVSFKATKKLVFYGQFLFDEFLLSAFRDRTGWWANKWATQLGFKVYDFVGVENLYLQGEFNVARPFTYTHGSVLQNFGHYNQPLAHQLGTNFYEGILTGYYEKGNWYGDAFFMYARYGTDPDSLNLGGDIFKSYVNPSMDFGNKIAQGIKGNLYYQKLSAGYILNRNLNLRAAFSYTYRRNDLQYQKADNEHVFGIQISTGLYNSYRAF